MLLMVLLSAYVVIADGTTSRRAKCLIDCYIKCLNTGLECRYEEQYAIRGTVPYLRCRKNVSNTGWYERLMPHYCFYHSEDTIKLTPSASCHLFVDAAEPESIQRGKPCCVCLSGEVRSYTELAICYEKASAAQCNCNTSSRKSCSMNLNESIIQNSMTNDVVPVKTEYLDSRRIRIQMDVHWNHAFVYIFEYSTVSTTPDDWIFAGANSVPDITFRIVDACRDYQFRVIAIMKNEDPNHRLLVYRPRAIPVDLPTFAIAPEKIQTAPPLYNADDNSVVVYVSWENPMGYTDADIYGYEGPAIYPIQCNSPEAELPTPSVELYEGGGRLRISLPAEVLESKCRIWVEVQMLPRCVRLEPFSVQQSLELDCEKLTTLDVCKHELAPQCTNVVDVWGSGNNATIMWSPHAGFDEPLYYHIRYGPAQMQGIPPFASWTIASVHELQTPANITKLQLDVDVDVDYGIQICGVYNEHRKKPKFGLVRVIPFICTSCKTVPVESFGRCGECTKIEGPLLLGRRCHPKGGIGCTTAGVLPNVTEGKSYEDNMMYRLTVLPSDIFIDSPPESITTTFAVVNGDSDRSMQQTQDGSVQQQPASTVTASGTEKTPTQYGDSQLLSSTETTTIEQPTTKGFPSSTNRMEILATPADYGAIYYSNTVTASNMSNTTDKETNSAPAAVPPNVVTAPNEEKLQFDLDSCILFNGVICEFGCIDQATCQCPEITHILVDNGACIQRSDHRRPPFVCFSNADVKAIWNPRIHALQIRSREIFYEVKMHAAYDRLFLEFGRVRRVGNIQNAAGGFIFDEHLERNNKMVIRTDKILRKGLFLSTPYSLYTNQSIDPVSYRYGLRICAFNKSEIKNPFASNWSHYSERSPEDDENNSDSDDNGGNDAHFLQMSAIQFEPEYMPKAISVETKQMTRLAFVIIPVILIVLLIFFLTLIIYLNCARLKRCYDRRKTRHFRPYVWNGSTIPPVCQHVNSNGTIYDKNSFIITKSSY